MKSVDTLHDTVSKGVKARQHLSEHKDHYAELQKQYLTGLLMRVRNGDDIEYHATALSVLDDIVSTLAQTIEGGRRAEHQLDTIALQKTGAEGE